MLALQEAYEHSPYVQKNRFDSFSPIRENSICKYYVDGADYFHDVCDSLLTARNEVFITDWWLSPEIYLKRPVSSLKNKYTRLGRQKEKKLFKYCWLSLGFLRIFVLSLINL